MKNLLSKLTVGRLAMLFTVVVTMACVEDENLAPTSGPTTPRATIPNGSFSLWTTCGSNAYQSGGNIIVPIGTGCGTKVNAAQANYSIYGSNWYCNGSIN